MKHAKNCIFRCDIKINPVHKIFTHESLIVDLKQFCNLNNTYDIIISSKFLNEFYRKTPDIAGLYTNLIHLGHDILDQSGILIITELTDQVSKKRNPPDLRYLNKIFSQETKMYFYKHKNSLKQILPLPCSMWRDICRDTNRCFVQHQYLDGVSKAFTQIFCFKTLGANFYDSSFMQKWSVRPIRINRVSIQNKNTFCYQGKLYDGNQIPSELYY
ncbi:MAG: hypothetical protein HQK61_04090 [Desulfamplus sp.]|nr:hypothetical protein [Desulfamplus sp.]